MSMHRERVIQAVRDAQGANMNEKVYGDFVADLVENADQDSLDNLDALTHDRRFFEAAGPEFVAAVHKVHHLFAQDPEAHRVAA